MGVRVLGVPMDLGADRRGVDMGPSAIRYGGLAANVEAAGIACADGGDIAVPAPEEGGSGDDALDTGHAKFYRETKAVCQDVRVAVSETIDAGHTPLVLGGDHSIAIGTVAGSATQDSSLGIIWFDAHGDFNTPDTTPSGNIHGMPLAAILGYGSAMEWAHTEEVAEENVALVGLRSVDERERDCLEASDVTTFTMSDIDARGMHTVVQEAVEIATAGTDHVHVSLDLDWLDPTEAPGVGTPVRGGVSYREAHTAMEYIAKHRTKIRSLELVEVNPILDTRNQTAELACELAASAFGKRVL